MYGSNLTSFMTISMDLMKLCSYMCAKATDIFWLALRFLALSIDKWPAALPPLTAAATFWLTWIFFMSRKHSSFVKQVDPPQSLINEKIWSFLIIGPIFLCCLSGWLFVGFPQSKNASITFSVKQSFIFSQAIFPMWAFHSWVANCSISGNENVSSSLSALNFSTF